MSSPRTALITGASSGIGMELARLLAREGYHLVIVARDAHALQVLAQELQQRWEVQVRVLPQDLSHPDAAQAIVQRLQSATTRVDVLINNAGFGTHGPFAASELDSQLRMVQVNIAALTQLTRLLLPPMVSQRTGKILNVASTAAFQPGPLMAVYYASKAYVLSFSEALAEELRGTGVTVTTLCPGPTQTQFQQRAGMEHTILMSRGVMSPAAVALAGYRGMQQGKTLVIPGIRNRLLASMVRLLPRGVVVRLVKRIQETRPSIF